MIDSGSMTESRLPLDGIRVLELAQVVAGPFCGALMAEFGAEVIKTEMPGRGDDLRRLGPTEDGCTYWFAVDNRNKLMTLDLHVPRGQEIVRRLVAQCDVVLENFRPGVLERWGSAGTPSMRSIRGWSWRGSPRLARPGPRTRDRATRRSARPSAAPGTSTAPPTGRPRARRRSTPTT